MLSCGGRRCMDDGLGPGAAARQRDARDAQSSRLHAVLTLHLGSATSREGSVGGVLCCSDEL